MMLQPLEWAAILVGLIWGFSVFEEPGTNNHVETKYKIIS